MGIYSPDYNSGSYSNWIRINEEPQITPFCVEKTTVPAGINS